MNQSPDKPKNAGLKRPPARRENFFISYWGIWVVLVVVFIFAASKIAGNAPHGEEGTEAAAAIKPPAFGEPEYVGSKRCKDCHLKEHDAWQNTLHSRFVQLPDEYTVMGDFEKESILSRDNDLIARMSRKDGRFYVNTAGPDSRLHDYEVDYVIGIGKRQNYITTFPDGGMHVLPVEWDVNKGEWVELNKRKNHYPGDEKNWSDAGNVWQIKCGGCHVTGIKINYDKAKDSFQSTWVELGIGCEACHGAGSNHVKAASVYFDHEKEPIVNPAKLPWRLRAMVCGQCHNWGESTAAVPPNKKGFPEKYGYPYGYQPGKSLNHSYDEASGEQKKHHQQYNEWKESQHAKAGIMCTSCHSVHDIKKEGTINVSQTKQTADNLCLGCHTTLQRRSAHRIHTFGSCSSCHMPQTVGHEHSHTFQFVSPAESIKAGGVDKKPNSCSGCHHHKDTPLENLVEFLNAAKKADMPIPFTVHGR